jgi:hypothetical protein
MFGIRNVYKSMVGKPEKKRPVGRPRCRWEDTITEAVWDCGLDSSGSGDRPAAGCCENGKEPWCSIKGGEFLD